MSDRIKRPAELVLSILGQLQDSEDPIPWNELLELYEAQNHKTIAGTLTDLANYGALRITGRYKLHNDTRAVQLTTLGAAWLHQELIELPHKKASRDEAAARRTSPDR